MSSLLSADVRLCRDSTCLTSYADFTAAIGVCQPSQTSGSIQVDLSVDHQTAHFQAFDDDACATPATLDMELTLDGKLRFNASSSLWYTAALSQSCLPPDPFLPYYSTMAGASGHQPGDMGNIDACLSNAWQFCSIQDKNTGLFAGACLPRFCSEADVTNSTSPIWGYLALQVPVWSYVLPTAQLQAHCGTQQFPVDDGASKTIAALVVVGVLVLLATLYAVVVRPPRKGDPFFAAADAAVRAASLTTTVPRLFGAAAAPRARDASAPRLDAFDGVRVLSLSLVVLGHSFFFPFTLTGYSNGYSVYDNLGTIAFQVIPSAEFAVDSFFALSGALGAYLFAKGLKKAFRKAAVAEGLVAPPPSAVDDKGSARASSLNDSAQSSLLYLINGDAPDDGDASSPPPPPAFAVVRCAARSVASVVGAWAYATVHRWLRLIPSVGAMIAIFAYVAPLLGDGPFWRASWESSIASCNDHAWADLLFLNNFFPGRHDEVFGNQCAGWLWYLAVDFQLHVVAIAPLCAAFAANDISGWVLLSGAIGGTVALSAVSVTQHSITFLAFLSQASSSTLGNDYSNDFYNKPVERAPAFLVGVGLGWALLAWETRTAAAAAKRSADAVSDVDKSSGSGLDADPRAAEEDGSARLVRAIFPTLPDGRLDIFATVGVAASLILLGALFYLPVGAYQGELGQTPLAPYAPTVPYAGSASWNAAKQQTFTVVSRPLWALGLCGLLYFCATRRGGLLEAALSAQFWRPVATLSFGAYLYHPVVLYVLNAAAGASPRFSPAYLATTYAATCVYSCAMAGVMYVIVEAPAAALEKFALDAAIKAALRQ